VRRALYVERDSLLHRLHPGVKVLLLLCYFVAALVVEDWRMQWALVLFVLLCAVRSGAGGNLRAFAKFLTVIGAMTVLLWSLYETKLALRVTPRSLEFAGRICGMLIAGLLFLSVTRIEEFTYALSRAGLPASVTMALGLAFRFVPILTGTAVTVVALQSLRGLDLRRGSLLQRLRKYLPLLVPVLITALRNVPQLAMALEGRGFGLRRRPTPFRIFPFRVADALTLLMAALAVGALAARFHGG